MRMMAWVHLSSCHRSVKPNLRAPHFTCFLPAVFLTQVSIMYIINKNKPTITRWETPESLIWTPTFCHKGVIKLVLHPFTCAVEPENVNSYLPISRRAKRSEEHLSNAGKPKHKAKSTAPRSSQQCFLMVPWGNAVERACHIKYQRETRSLCSNVKNAGNENKMLRRNAEMKTRGRRWRRVCTQLSNKLSCWQEGRRGFKCNSISIFCSEKQKMFQASALCFFCFFNLYFL